MKFHFLKTHFTHNKTAPEGAVQTVDKGPDLGDKARAFSHVSNRI